MDELISTAKKLQGSTERIALHYLWCQSAWIDLCRLMLSDGHPIFSTGLIRISYFKPLSNSQIRIQKPPTRKVCGLTGSSSELGKWCLMISGVTRIRVFHPSSLRGATSLSEEDLKVNSSRQNWLNVEWSKGPRYSLSEKPYIVFPASRGLSRRGKLKRRERDLCRLPTSYLMEPPTKFLVET